MFKEIANFYRTSAPAAPLDINEKEQNRLYRKLSLQSFIAGTLGYSLYYVCRTSINVMKKPILDSGMLDAKQLGIIGSALLFAYAIGKFVNGFICDYCNIKKFMATGLIISAVANLMMGILGLGGLSFIPTAAIFIAFAIMWGVNGWAQSMGAPRQSSPCHAGSRSTGAELSTGSSAQAITSESSSRSSSSV